MPLGSLVAYTAFPRLVREWGASRAGSYALVSPIIAVGLGVLFVGEDVTPVDAWGWPSWSRGAWLTRRPVEPGHAAVSGTTAQPPPDGGKRARRMA